MNKDKNAINIALKSMKQDLRSQSKAFDKELMGYQKKISELNEFKTKRLNEERKERLTKKKELKKEANKNKIGGNNNTASYEKTCIDGKNKEENSGEHEEKGAKSVSASSEQSTLCVLGEPSLPFDPDLDPGKSGPNSKFSEETSNENYEKIELEEKEEGFIGPRLPRMLTGE